MKEEFIISRPIKRSFPWNLSERFRAAYVYQSPVAWKFLEVSSQTIRGRFDRCCPSSSVAARSHPFPTGRPASPSLMRPWWEATSWEREPARPPLPRLPGLSMPAIISLVTFVIVSAGHPAGSFLPVSIAKACTPTNPRTVISRRRAIVLFYRIL